MEVGFGYSFDEDGLMRLQKDLNHLLTNLNDQNVRSLKTEICTIEARGHETVLDGSLLKMYDYIPLTSQASTTLRLQMGYDKTSSNFSFKLFNAAGVETISIDSLGNGVFSGDITSSNDVKVGNNIYMGVTDSTALKGIYFNTTTASTSMDVESMPNSGLLWSKSTELFILYSTNNLNIAAIHNLNLKAGYSTVLDSNSARIIMTSNGAQMLSEVTASIGLYTTALGLYQSVGVDSSGISLYTTNRVYLGLSSNNTFIGGSNVSTQLVATRGWTALKVVRRSATTTIVNTTVFADDSELVLSLDSDAKFQIEAHVAYLSTAASQKLIVSWSTDGITQFASRECIGPSTDSTGIRGLGLFGRYNMGDTVRYAAPTLSGGTAAFSEKAIVITGSTSPDVHIRFAQKVASTTPMTISISSYITARRITT